MASEKQPPAERQQARRRVADGRVVVVPPEGQGEVWNGSAR